MYVNIALFCLDIVGVPGKIIADFLTLPQLQMMIGAADLSEIGKYIDSPLKQKFFPNKSDTGQKLLGAEVKLMWINSLPERR